MGLENGIIVKSNRRKITRDMLPAAIVYPFDEDEPEIIYWRKNGGLRDAVIDHFCWRAASEKQIIFEIDTPEQVIELIEVIASFLDEEYWEENGNSIWDYKIIRRILIQNIINLALIQAFMYENPDVYLEFYDSY